MNAGFKSSKSVPIPMAAAVNTRQVNVAVDAIDPTGIPGSFSIHLLRDGQRIASRFVLRPSEGLDPDGALAGGELVHVDFLLPIDAVADGMLSIEIDSPTTSATGGGVPLEQIGHPTMSVYLMLETR